MCINIIYYRTVILTKLYTVYHIHCNYRVLASQLQFNYLHFIQTP